MGKAFDEFWFHKVYAYVFADFADELALDLIPANIELSGMEINLVSVMS